LTILEFEKWDNRTMAASSGAFWDHLWIVGLCSIFLLLLVFPPGVAARIPLPKGTEDVRDLFASAPLVFHGRVLNVESREHRSIEEDVKHFDWDARNNQARIATFQVDRWYKGSSQLSTVKLQFDYGADAINGHDCIDLRQNTTWLVMARQRGDGVLEFSDDCEGGLPASSILSPYSSEAGVRQLQRDLIAGLQDNDSAMRLENIKRLGGLKLQSSSGALQPLVDHGSESESQWATYAMFRSGDLSILHEAAEMVESGQSKISIMPARWMTVELRFLTGPLAVPLLMDLAKSTGHTLAVRNSAIAALEEMRDPRTLPDLASHLDDSDDRIQFNVLAAMDAMTQTRQCSAPRGRSVDPSQVALQAATCMKWWKAEGSLLKWPRADELVNHSTP